MAYAGFLRRLVALLVDAVIVTIVYYIFRTIIFTVFGVSDAILYFIVVITVVAGWLYFAMMEASDKQATFGKMAIGIKVTDMSGKRISFGKATGRYFGKYISQLILYIGFIMVAFTAKKQGLHDMMAGTLVVMK